MIVIQLYGEQSLLLKQYQVKGVSSQMDYSKGGAR